MTLTEPLARTTANVVQSSDWFALRDAVRDWRPDLIVAVARKMPRIDEAMALGFREIALTVADPAIPFIAPYVAGARVAVVDDVVNVGSTLENAQRLLVRMGASEVMTFALQSRLSGSSTPNLRRVAFPQDRDRFCDSVAIQSPEIVARVSKAFDLDFPVIPCRFVMPFSTPEDLASEAEQRIGVRVFSTTRENGAHPRTSRLTLDRSARSTIRKMRVYFDAETGDLNVVPMLISAPLPPVPVARSPWAADWHGKLAAAAGDWLTDEVSSRISMFIDSMHWGLECLRELRHVIVPVERNVLDLSEAGNVFGPAAQELSLPQPPVDGTCAEPSSPPASVNDLEEIESPAFDSLWPDLVRVLTDALPQEPLLRAVSVFEALSEFVGGSATSEYQATWPYSRAEVLNDPYLRLRIGFTFGDLAGILSYSDGVTPDRSRDWALVASKVVDRLVDSGSLVPTLANYGGKVYRIYRKGEGRYREDAVDRILLGMVEYEKGMSRTRISKVGVILAFARNGNGFTHVASETRGNVLALDEDLLDSDPEITNYLRRIGAIQRT